MRIGFDISQTGQDKAGCGYFAESLIRHLAILDFENEYILYPTFGDFYWDPDWPSTTCQIDRPNSRRGLGHRTYEALWAFWNNPPPDLEAQLGNPDLIHSNNFFCPLRLKQARLIYTLHDLSFLEHPEWTTEGNRIGCFRGVFHASLYADLIIAVSEYTRRHFLETFPHYPGERIIVIPLASRFPGPTEIPQPKSLPPLQPERFWLNVATLEPRKNHLRLLRAYARLKAHLGQTFPLVLAGGKGWLLEDLEQTIEELSLQQEVIRLGYVDDETLQWLYQNCFAFVYPSLFEGFGLPVLEAMSLGAAVIASKTTSLPEVVGSAGLLVDPLAKEDIFQGMLQLSTDMQLHANLKERAMQQASKFSWKSAAAAVLECYNEIMAYRSKIFNGMHPKIRSS